MFDKLKKLFTFDDSSDKQLPSEELDRQITLATCVLLLEIATTDDDFSIKEETSIRKILSERYKLSSTDIDDLIKEASVSREDSTDLYEFTYILNKHLSKESKQKLIHSVWDVIYADGVFDQYEDHLVHRLSDLLHIEHEDMIRAKIEARPDDYKGIR